MRTERPMAIKKRHLFYFILACLFFFSIYSCSSEKTQTASIAEKDGTSSAGKPSTEVGSPGTISQRGSKPEASAKGSETTPANNPPAITKAELRPENIRNTDSLKIVAEGSDKDGDEVTFNYEWIKNSEPAGNSNTITGFKRGDKISVRITPFDGKDYGQPKTIYTEIRNTNPKIVEHKEAMFDGKSYSYQVRAADPDGDPLSYSLKSAPPGMTIDPLTGLIKWEVPPDFKGKNPIIVSVTDDHGGEASQSFYLEIKSERNR